MPLYRLTNARGKGPRGVNRLGGGTTVIARGDSAEVRVGADELDDLRVYFDAELLSDEGDPIPAEDTRAQRVWLAVANDATGAGMHPLKTGEHGFIGFAVGTERPQDPAAYRFSKLPTDEQVSAALAAAAGQDDDDEPDPLDHDNDGTSGGSNPHDPPALKGLNKAQLTAIAEAEGVELEEGATNAQITAAIEAARAIAAAE